jgi:steroid delta-isomerase-like uncharacterized protein
MHSRFSERKEPMRRAALVLSLAILNTFALFGNTASAGQQGTPSAVADPELAARFFEATFNADTPATDLLKSGFVFHLVGEPDMDAGAFVAFIAGFRAAFPDLHIAVQTAFGQGDRIATYWTLRGTQEGPYQDIPATHKAVLGVPGDAIFRVADGQIAEVWAIVDTVGILQRLGVWLGSGALAEAGPPSPLPGTPPDPDSVATVERFYVAWSTGDMDTMAQLQPGWDQRNYIAWQGIFSSSYTIEDVVASGDLVMVRLTLTGTQIGSYGDLPPTDRPIRIGEMDLWRVQIGQPTGYWHVWDNFGIVQQLLAPATPAATPTA